MEIVTVRSFHRVFSSSYREHRTLTGFRKGKPTPPRELLLRSNRPEGGSIRKKRIKILKKKIDLILKRAAAGSNGQEKSSKTEESTVEQTDEETSQVGGSPGRGGGAS